MSEKFNSVQLAGELMGRLTISTPLQLDGNVLALSSERCMETDKEVVNQGIDKQDDADLASSGAGVGLTQEFQRGSCSKSSPTDSNFHCKVCPCGYRAPHAKLLELHINACFKIKEALNNYVTGFPSYMRKRLKNRHSYVCMKPSR